MTNDYLKGHAYRWKTDANYRRRHTGAAPPNKGTSPGICARCHRRAQRIYHHTPNGGRWVCRKCHGALHKDQERKTPGRRRR